jgi:hypothetical protein
MSLNDVNEDIIRYIVSYFPILPHLFKLQRVSKAWQDACNTHLDQHILPTNLHFGSEGINNEQLTLECMSKVMKRCRPFTTRITLCNKTINEEMTNLLIEHFAESSKFEEIIFACCKTLHYYRISLHALKTLKKVTVISDDHYCNISCLHVNGVKGMEHLLRSYNDEAYFSILNRYRLKNVVSRHSVIDRFFDASKTDLFESCDVIAQFYLKEKVLNVNERLNSIEYNIGHALLNKLNVSLVKTRYMLKLSHEAIKEYYQKWCEDEKVNTVELLQRLMAMGLDVNARAGMPEKSVIDMAESIDYYWDQLFKAAGITDQVLTPMVGIFDHCERVKDKAEVKQKQSLGKRKKKDDDNDSDYEEEKKRRRKSSRKR